MPTPEREPRTHRRAVPMTAVWVRRGGGEKGPATVEVLVEIDGPSGPTWVVAITEILNSNFSHIAEGNGADHWKPPPWLPSRPEAPHG